MTGRVIGKLANLEDMLAKFQVYIEQKPELMNDDTIVAKLDWLKSELEALYLKTGFRKP